MSRSIKILVSALLVALAALPAVAADFSARRGLNLDLWVTWPDESDWGKRKVMLPFPEWRRSLDRTGLEQLREAGFDFVRIPVDPSVFLSPKTAALRDELYDSVAEAAALANDAGLKAIVDLHWIPAGGNRAIGTHEVLADDSLFDAYVEAVRQVAGRLAEVKPSQVALELFNEPILDCEGGDEWPPKLKRMHDAARVAAPRLTLVLTGGCWGDPGSLARLDPAAIADDNVIWAFHSYQPFLLTHQGATWAGDFIPYVTGIPYPPDSVPRAELDRVMEEIRARMRSDAPAARRDGLLSYLDEQLAEIDTSEKLRAGIDHAFTTVADWARENAIPPERILLGEFGMIRQEYGNPYVMPGAWRAAYGRDMIDLAEQHGFAWSIFGYGGAFGIVEEFEGRPAEPDVLDMVRSLP